jgi:hypothetical protein
VTDRHTMLIPLWHLILPSICRGVRVDLDLVYFVLGLWSRLIYTPKCRKYAQTTINKQTNKMLCTSYIWCFPFFSFLILSFHWGVYCLNCLFVYFFFHSFIYSFFVYTFVSLFFFFLCVCIFWGEEISEIEMCLILHAFNVLYH